MCEDFALHAFYFFLQAWTLRLLLPLLRLLSLLLRVAFMAIPQLLVQSLVQQLLLP